jgi:hypothetical protein
VLQKEAETAIRAMRIQDKAILDTKVYKGLFDRFNGDTDMMREALMDPQGMEAYGITLENVKSIEASITDLEKRKAAQSRQIERGYLQKLIKGQLSEFEIGADVGAGKIDAKIGEHWINSIKTRNEIVDPIGRAKEVVRINAMISREEDPDKIRDEIVRSRKLGKEDYEQYLNKLEGKLTDEMKEGRRRGYEEILNLITPKRGMLATLIQTPVEAVAVSKAQMALDDWIDGQKRQNKMPTLNEIRRKAIELGETYQVPMAEKLREIEEEANRAAAETKKYGEEKTRRRKAGMP